MRGQERDITSLGWEEGVKLKSGEGNGEKLREKQNLMGRQVERETYAINRRRLWVGMLMKQDLLGGRVGKNTYGERGEVGRK